MPRRWIVTRLNWAIVLFWETDTQRSFKITNHRLTPLKTKSSVCRLTSIFTVEWLSLFRPLVMGCYGIGVTRLMAAAVEILTPRDSTTIHWPRRIAPYQVAIIPPKVSLSRAEKTVYIAASLSLSVERQCRRSERQRIDSRASVETGP